MIICGTRGFRKIIGSTMKMYFCNRCGRMEIFEIMQEWVWFTLFFIPIFPIYKNYYLVCPHCQGIAEIKKKEVNAYMYEV